MMKRSWLLLLLMCVPADGHACGWYSNTVDDELQNNATLFELITGQVPHHGATYFTEVLRRANAKLMQDPSNPTAEMDRAYALLQLGDFENAERLLLATGATNYQALSNLGVLTKKLGRYADSTEYLAKALAIRPEGHLGLGDYYLKRVRYSASLSDQRRPRRNFLGHPYRLRKRAADSPRLRKQLEIDSYVHGDPTLKKRELEKLKSLIKADRHFADAYFVLGDELVARGQLNLALLAFARAMSLGHPRPDQIEARAELIFGHWAGTLKTVYGRGKALSHERASDGLSAAARELSELSQKWEAEFDAAEAVLISRGHLPSFSETRSYLLEK
ncbi:MAG: hypothetical protein AAFX94_19495 [Myxococcota bacterium]